MPTTWLSGCMWVGALYLSPEAWRCWRTGGLSEGYRLNSCCCTASAQACVHTNRNSTHEQRHLRCANNHPALMAVAPWPSCLQDTALYHISCRRVVGNGATLNQPTPTSCLSCSHPAANLSPRLLQQLCATAFTATTAAPCTSGS